MNRRPLASGFLGVVLACFVLAGCGNKQSQESSQPAAPAEPVLTLDPLQQARSPERSFSMAPRPRRNRSTWELRPLV